MAFVTCMIMKKSKFVYLNPEFSAAEGLTGGLGSQQHESAVTVWDYTSNLISGEAQELPKISR